MRRLGRIIDKVRVKVTSWHAYAGTAERWRYSSKHIRNIGTRNDWVGRTIGVLFEDDTKFRTIETVISSNRENSVFVSVTLVCHFSPV